jgi:hypothetical protein
MTPAERKRRQRERDPVKYRARRILDHRIARGTADRPESCEVCRKRCKPEGHHPDYSIPWQVIWLCRDCHRDVTRSETSGVIYWALTEEEEWRGEKLWVPVLPWAQRMTPLRS